MAAFLHGGLNIPIVNSDFNTGEYSNEDPQNTSAETTHQNERGLADTGIQSVYWLFLNVTNMHKESFSYYFQRSYQYGL